jgi:hypothetical protein
MPPRHHHVVQPAPPSLVDPLLLMPSGCILSSRRHVMPCHVVPLRQCISFPLCSTGYCAAAWFLPAYLPNGVNACGPEYGDFRGARSGSGGRELWSGDGLLVWVLEGELVRVCVGVDRNTRKERNIFCRGTMGFSNLLTILAEGETVLSRAVKGQLETKLQSYPQDPSASRPLNMFAHADAGTEYHVPPTPNVTSRHQVSKRPEPPSHPASVRCMRTRSLPCICLHSEINTGYTSPSSDAVSTCRRSQLAPQGPLQPP